MSGSIENCNSFLGCLTTDYSNVNGLAQFSFSEVYVHNVCQPSAFSVVLFGFVFVLLYSFLVDLVRFHSDAPAYCGFPCVYMSD